MAQSEYVKKHGADNHSYWGTAAPTSGTYAKGDIIWNSAPAAGSPSMWVCTVAGSPGTWVSIGNVNAKDIYFGTAAPASGTYKAGDVVFNSAPSDGGIIGWQCSVAGTPGTWVILGYSRSDDASEFLAVTHAAAAVLTAGKGLQLITLSAGATMTLAAAASHPPGFRMGIKNLANNSVTIATVAGATYADAAAITLAQNASVTVVGDGATWYKID